MGRDADVVADGILGGELFLPALHGIGMVVLQKRRWEVKHIFILLVLFQIKHFVCDFPLQGKYMLGKFKPDFKDWFQPLLAHAMVHFIGTGIFVIPLYCLIAGVKIQAWWAFLAAGDLIVHFTVDRIKASPNMLGRWKPDNRYFWWALGADQMAHHLTHYAIIAVLVWKT